MTITESIKQHTSSAIPPAAPPKDAGAWIIDQVRAFGTITALATPAFVLGISRSLAYRLPPPTPFPIPMIRLDTRIRATVDELHRLFLANDHLQPGSVDGRLDLDAEASVDVTTTGPGDSPPHSCLCRIRAHRGWSDDH